MNALKVLTIKRIALNPDSVLGVILDETTPFALTLERPWLDNRPSISCIPKGEYTIKRVVKLKHGECFQVMDVPNRTDILIHKGNFVEDSEGCILIGEQFEDILSTKADKVVTSIQRSGVAYSELMVRLHRQDEAKLVILEV